MSGSIPQGSPPQPTPPISTAGTTRGQMAPVHDEEQQATDGLAKHSFTDVDLTPKTLKGHKVSNDLKMESTKFPFLKKSVERVKHFFTFELGLRANPELWTKAPPKSAKETQELIVLHKLKGALIELKGALKSGNYASEETLLLELNKGGRIVPNWEDGNEGGDKNFLAIFNANEFKEFSNLLAEYNKSGGKGLDKKGLDKLDKALDKAISALEDKISAKTSWSKKVLDKFSFSFSKFTGPAYLMTREYAHKRAGEKISEEKRGKLIERGNELRSKVASRKEYIEGNKKSIETSSDPSVKEMGKKWVGAQIKALDDFNTVIDGLLEINQQQIDHWGSKVDESAFMRELGLAHEERAHLLREKHDILLAKLAYTAPQAIATEEIAVPQATTTAPVTTVVKEEVKVAKDNLTNILKVCNSQLRLGGVLKDGGKDTTDLERKFDPLLKKMSFTFDYVDTSGEQKQVTSYKDFKKLAEENPKALVDALKAFKARLDEDDVGEIIKALKPQRANESMEGTPANVPHAVGEIGTHIDNIEKQLSTPSTSTSPSAPVTPTSSPISVAPTITVATSKIAGMGEDELKYLAGKRQEIKDELAMIFKFGSNDNDLNKVVSLRYNILNDQLADLDKAEEYRNAHGGNIKDHVELLEASSGYLRELKEAEDWSTRAGEAGIWRQSKIILRLKTESGVFTSADYQKGTKVTNQVEYREDKEAYLEAGHYHLEAYMSLSGSGLRAEKGSVLGDTLKITDVERENDQDLAKSALKEALKFYQLTLGSDNDHGVAVQTLANLYYRGVETAGQVLLEYIEKTGGKLSKDELRFLFVMKGAQNAPLAQQAQVCLEKFGKTYPKVYNAASVNQDINDQSMITKLRGRNQSRNDDEGPKLQAPSKDKGTAALMVEDLDVTISNTTNLL